MGQNEEKLCMYVESKSQLLEEELLSSTHLLLLCGLFGVRRYSQPSPQINYEKIHVTYFGLSSSLFVMICSLYSMINIFHKLEYYESVR